MTLIQKVADFTQRREGAIRLWLWSLLLVEVAVAIVFLHPWVTGDTQRYLDLASSLTRGAYGTYVEGQLAADATRPPGYPIVLAILHASQAPLLTVLVQAALYLASIAVAAHYLRSKAVSDVYLLLLAIAYPFPLFYSVPLMAEAWALAGLTYIGTRVANAGSMKRSASLGVASGVLSLFRSDLLLLPLVISLIALMKSPRQPSQYVIAPIAAAVVLLPYSYWNWSAHNRFSPVPIASAVGTSLYLAQWQGKLDNEDLNLLYQGKTTPAVVASGLASEVAKVNRRIGAPELTSPFSPLAYPTTDLQVAANKAFGRAAWLRVQSDPMNYVRHCFQNLWRLWNTSSYPASLPAPAALLLRASSWMVFLLGFFAILTAALRRGTAGATWEMAAITLYLPAVHLLLHTEARYTGPARVLLMIFAASALSGLARRMRVRFVKVPDLVGYPASSVDCEIEPDVKHETGIPRN